jgi:hypothetical protein
MIVVAAIIASAVSITRGDSACVAVIAWAFVGSDAPTHLDSQVDRGHLGLVSMRE